MNENNELNDIILNKDGAASPNKKIILAVATLGIILIIVVILMNSLNSSSNDNLPQAVLPPEPATATAQESTSEPLFEDIEVEEESTPDANLEQITQKLKQESLAENNTKSEEIFIKEPVVTPKPVLKKKKVVTPKPVLKKKKVVTPKITHKKRNVVASGSYYIQVGSFSKYEPNKKFLKSISNLGYSYKYHKIKSVNKVLVGPFKTAKEAKNAKRVLRAKVEPGAFLVKL